jgi:ribosomal-protein-alanine acetyltransferase
MTVVLGKLELVVVWEFQVLPNKRCVFEEAYGPDGIWARFFRDDPSYVRTELMRDPQNPLRYVTIDVWGSREAYERFENHNEREYRAIDKACESLMQNETKLGEFEAPGDQIADCDVIIRTAVPDDIGNIVGLEKEAPSAAHWAEGNYKRMFNREAPHRVVLVAGRKLNSRTAIGFVVARFVGEDCELENIVVAQENQSRGVGAKLLHGLIQTARTRSTSHIHLEVRESNVRARRLYENCGFKVSGRRPLYYSGPVEDAILYALEL